MTVEEELRQEIADLRMEVAALRKWITGACYVEPRLGPRPETPEEAAARSKKIADALAAAVRDAQPVDRSQLATTNGQSVAEVRAGQTNETGQHAGYIVLSEAERAKGFVRPFRDKYKHVGTDGSGGCGIVTSMGRALSETYARDPTFYSSTFCCGCNRHLPVNDFIWTADDQRVGS
jgi:hypothetical protein